MSNVARLADKRAAPIEPSIADIARNVRRPAALTAAMHAHEQLRQRANDIGNTIRTEIATGRDGPGAAEAGRRIAALTAQRDALAPQLAGARRTVLDARGPHIEAVKAAVEARSHTAAIRVRDALSDIQAGLATLLEVDEELVRVGAERRMQIPPALLRDIEAVAARLPR